MAGEFRGYEPHYPDDPARGLLLEFPQRDYIRSNSRTRVGGERPAFYRQLGKVSDDVRVFQGADQCMDAANCLRFVRVRILCFNEDPWVT